jgi:hypothetical protein
MTELDRLVGHHLTAAAVMVDVAEPFPPATRAFEARRQLEHKDFDLALVDDERLRVVSRSRLDGLTKQQLGLPVLEFADSPRRDRLIERSLPAREIVRRLRLDSEPLLVVGESGVTHIVTIADFAGVAGTAVALSFLLAVDRGLNELLRPQAEEAIEAISAKQREGAETRRARAEADGAALDLIDYLSMGARFVAIRKLGLHGQFNLGTAEEHKLMLDVRNDAAHRELSDPSASLRVIEVAEQMLDRLTAVLAKEEEWLE